MITTIKVSKAIGEFDDHLVVLEVAEGVFSSVDHLAWHKLRDRFIVFFPHLH